MPCSIFRMHYLRGNILRHCPKVTTGLQEGDSTRDYPATKDKEMTFIAILSMLLLAFETFKSRGNH